MMRLLAIGLVGVLGFGCSIEPAETDEPVLDSEDVGTSEDGITGSGSFDAYVPALVRLDLQGGGRCSAVLVGPNLLVTAAHCVSDKTTDGVTSWNGMHYGKVGVRMVYKPSASETMCFNETCRNVDGTVRYSTVYAFWDDSYSGDGDWNDDMAVLTRISQADFVTKALDPGDPAPRNLGADDFRRILNVGLPTSGDGWEMMIAGYGAEADGQFTSNPRAGFMQVNDWNSHTMVANYNSGTFWSSTCKGDSGGPITFTNGIGGTTYLGGVTVGTNDNVSSDCPEVGDDIVFQRLSAKVWLLNRVRQWIEGEDCTLYTAASLPGSGEYYRCW